MNKLKKIGILGIPALLVTSALLIVFSISKKDDSPKKNKKIKTIVQRKAHDIYENVNIFPELESKFFYSYMRMSEDSKNPIINDKMVAYIVKYIIHNMNVSSGTIKWGYKKISLSEVRIQISWTHTYNEQEFSYSHTYSFNATNSI